MGLFSRFCVHALRFNAEEGAHEIVSSEGVDGRVKPGHDDA